MALMSNFLTATAGAIDRLVAAIGRAVIWLSLAVVLVHSPMASMPTRRSVRCLDVLSQDSRCAFIASR